MRTEVGFEHMLWIMLSWDDVNDGYTINKFVGGGTLLDFQNIDINIIINS